MTGADEAVYVYGVASTSATPVPSVRGVESADIRGIDHAGVVALVSPIHRTELRAPDVRAHWRVLEHAFEHGTVLPVRFGTVMESDEAVRSRLLEPNADRLSELLARMDGLVQLNVKGRYDEDALLREIVREEPAVARLRARVAKSGTVADQVALGQLVETQIGRRRVRDTATARDALEPLVSAAREEQVRHPEAFNLACLVDRDSTDGLSEGVGSLREQLGSRIEIRYVGPVPPFSFAETELSGWA